MDVFISGFVLILVQDLLIIGMLIYIYFRIADLKTKILFSIFLLSSFLWSNMSLLTRFPDLSDSKRLLFAMFTFSSSFVFINSMVYFVFHVGGILKKEFKNPIFIFLQTLSLLFAALSFTQLTFKDVKYGFPVLNISFGPVYYAAMVMYLFYAVYFFSVLVSAYRRSSEILLKIQLRYILYAIGSSAAVMLFINGVLAKWIEGAPYFSIGHFSIAILFIVSAYILIRGKYLVLDYQYQILRNQFALKNEDHLKTLQKLFQTVQKELDSDHEVQTDRIASSLWKIRSFSDLPADDCSVSEEPLYEEMIQKNLFPENSVGLLSEKNAIPDTDYFQVSEYEDLIRANRSYLSHFFSVPFVCFSKEFYNLLIQTVHVSYFQLPVLFCGETGTYRKDLARAMHYFRRAENLKEISCAAVSPYELSQNIRKFLDEPETGRPGLLISDMDRLGRKGIEIIESLLLNPPKNKYLYFTSSSVFLKRPELFSENMYKTLQDSSLKTLPLRERKADIFFIILDMLINFNKNSHGLQIKKVSRGFMLKAVSYWWSGNMLELYRAVTKEILESSSGILEDFTGAVAEYSPSAISQLSPLEEGEKRVIHEYLLKNNYNKNRTKNELGISINTLNTKIDKYGIVTR